MSDGSRWVQADGSRWVQAVLFDAAGTLVELREPVGETYAREALHFGVAVPAWRIEEAFRRVLDAASANVHPGAPLPRARDLERAWWHARVRETFRAADQMARFDDFEAFFEALFARYAGAGAWRLRSGAAEALAALEKAGVRRAIVSNFDQRLRGLLRDLGILGRFEVVTLPSDAGAAKPDRRIFEVCLKRLGLPACRVVYVGDRAEEDLGGARAADIHAIDATSLATLAELPDRIERLNGGAPPVVGRAGRTAQKGS